MATFILTYYKLVFSLHLHHAVATVCDSMGRFRSHGAKFRRLWGPLRLEWFQPSIPLMLYQEVFQAQSCIFSLGFKVAFWSYFQTRMGFWDVPWTGTLVNRPLSIKLSYVYLLRSAWVNLLNLWIQINSRVVHLIGFKKSFVHLSLFAFLFRYDTSLYGLSKITSKLNVKASLWQ